jgi:hypothetical protein
MTGNKLALEEVRLALGKTMNARGYRKFSSQAREQALRYAHQRFEAGAKTSEVAAELGLIGWTLQRWLQQERRGAIAAAPTFVQLKVEPGPRREAVMHGPCGVWVSGLGPEGIAAVLRSLSCSA